MVFDGWIEGQGGENGMTVPNARCALEFSLLKIARCSSHHRWPSMLAEK